MLRSIRAPAPAFRFIRQAPVRTFSQASSDQITVSLEDNNPPVKDFFSYTWGRWLVGDEFKRKQRETQFKLKGLAQVVKDKIPPLFEGPQSAEVQVKLIEPLFEGKNHKLYKLDLTDGRPYVLRLPYKLGHESYRKAKMQSEVATMDFLSRKLDINMPQVLGYSADSDNPLGTPFMLMEYIGGEALMRSWDPAGDDLTVKQKALGPVAELYAKLVTPEFSKYGSLYFTEDVDASLQNDMPYAGETDKDLVDRWRIGPTTEERFWKGSSPSLGQNLRGPFESVQDYLTATAKIQLGYVTEMLHSSNDKDGSDELKKALATFENYERLTRTLFLDGELPAEIMSARLHHPDIDPLNIIVQSSGKTYLLDYECTAIRPFVLHGVPAFVKHRGPKIYNLADVPEYETLSESDRATVQHYYRQTQNQFAFEYMFRQHAVSEQLFGAFVPHIKRRQQLVETALDVSPGRYMDLAYEVLSLSQDWPMLGLDRPFALQFSKDQVQIMSADLDAWNAFVLQDPFFDSKGWLPAAQFEELLGKGIIVKNGSDYEYVK